MESDQPVNTADVPSEHPIGATISQTYHSRRWSWGRDSPSRLGRFLANYYSIAAPIVIVIWAGVILYYSRDNFRYIDDSVYLFLCTSFLGFGVPIFILTVIAPAARGYMSITNARVESELFSADVNSEASRTIIRALRRRARDLRLASWFALFLTFIAIAIGLYLFTIAGSIATSDYSARARYAEQEQERFRNFVDLTLRDMRQLLTDRDLVTPESSVKVIENVNKVISEQGNTINNNVKAVLEPTEQKGNFALYLLVSTISTRIGSVLLLIFLVQILISVYRYSVRLQTYYDARADALLLAHKSDAAELQQIVALLSPERIDFGKSPTAPSEHVFNAFKSAVSAAKTTKS